MPNTDQALAAQPPTAEAAKAEAETLMADPSAGYFNPNHARHKATHARVADLWKIHSPGQYVPDDGETVLAPPTTTPTGDRQWDPDEFGPDAAEQFRTVDAAMRQDLGAEYDGTMQAAGEVVREIAADHPAEFRTFSQLVRAKGPKAELAAVKFLAALKRL